jgi:hypothetical protein
MGRGYAVAPPFVQGGWQRSFTMKRNLFIIAGTLAMLLAFGLVLGGCASTGSGKSGKAEVETETSKMLENAAIDMMASASMGMMTVDQFTQQFERKFPGLKFTKASRKEQKFTYEGKEYLMKTKPFGNIGGTHIANVTSCVELQ